MNEFVYFLLSVLSELLLGRSGDEGEHICPSTTLTKYPDSQQSMPQHHQSTMTAPRPNSPAGRRDNSVQRRHHHRIVFQTNPSRPAPAPGSIIPVPSSARNREASQFRIVHHEILNSNPVDRVYEAYMKRNNSNNPPKPALVAPVPSYRITKPHRARMGPNQFGPATRVKRRVTIQGTGYTGTARSDNGGAAPKPMTTPLELLDGATEAEDPKDGLNQLRSAAAVGQRGMQAIEPSRTSVPALGNVPPTPLMVSQSLDVASSSLGHNFGASQIDKQQIRSFSEPGNGLSNMSVKTPTEPRKETYKVAMAEAGKKENSRKRPFEVLEDPTAKNTTWSGNAYDRRW